MTRYVLTAVLMALLLPGHRLSGRQDLADVPTGTFTYRLEVRWEDGRVDRVAGTLFIQHDSTGLQGRMVWDREWVASDDYRSIDLSDFQTKDGWLQFTASRRYQRRPRFGSMELDDVFYARIKFDDDDSYAGEWWDSKLRGDLFGKRAPP